MPKIVITSNCARTTHIQLNSTNPSSKGSAIDLGPLLTLLPGVNVVKTDLWERAKQNATVNLLLAERIKATPAPEQNPEKVGQMTLVEGPVLPDEAPLKDMKPVNALRMIVETLDVNLLRSWLDGEQRHDVRKAIEAQIDGIERPDDIKPQRGQGNRQE